MGTFRKISNEEKTAVMTAMQAYLEQGWTLNSAYKQVKADFLSEEKTIPAEMTVRRWCKQAGWTGNGDRELVRMNTERTEGTEAAETDEAARDPEEADAETDEAAENPEDIPGPRADYTRRLELVVRLYRTRTEDTVDAVCDELLPELIEEEN